MKMEFYIIYQIFPKRFEQFKNLGKIQFSICFRIYNLQSQGNFKLHQKGKLFLMFQTVYLQNLENFKYQEGHCFEFQSSGE
jgi:hypothetical protein